MWSAETFMAIGLLEDLQSVEVGRSVVVTVVGGTELSELGVS
jgi:hypothetical protein